MKRIIILGYLILLNITGYCQKENFIEHVDKYTIIATETDSVTFPPYFKHPNEIDSISKIYSNCQMEARAIEEFQLKSYSVNVNVDSKDRIVRLQNGKEIRLSPNYQNGEVEYAFEKEFKDFGFLLFRVQWYEGNDYFLLDTKTGEKKYTIGRTYFSNDKNFVISINNDILAEYSYNGFQLFKIESNGKLNQIWKFSPNWAPENIKWVDNETLIVKGYYYAERLEKKTFYKMIKISER